MTSKGTTKRTIRVAATLWEAAASRAADNGEHVSDVVRRALEQYVTTPPRPSGRPRDQ